MIGRGAVCAAAILCGCQGAVGTVDLELVTSPGSTVMDDVQRVRLTLTAPEKVVEVDRVDGRFDIDFEVTAEGQNSLILFEGLADDGTRIASGRSAPLPVAAIDASVKIFVAPPLSIEEAPEPLGVARSELASSRLSFGAIFLGGRDGDGAVLDDVEVYNVYDHAVQTGAPLPEARAGVSAMTGSFGLVWLFGGEDSSGEATHELLVFDTGVAPAGAYGVAASQMELARSHAFAVPIDSDAFAVLGDPMVLVDGAVGRANAWPESPSLDGTAASVLHNGVPNTLVTGDGAGASGATIIVNLALTSLDAPATVDRTGHATVILGNGNALVIGGSTAGGLVTSGVRFDFETRAFTVIDDLLETPRNDAAVASSGEYVVVAGGTDVDGNVVTTAEIIDALTLEHRGTVPMVMPRTGASAHALANGQIIVAGGLDPAGAPTDVLELFTP